MSKRNLFDTLNNSINSLKGLDEDGNKFSNDSIEDYNFRVEGIRKNINEFQEIFDNINLQHSNLGYKNRMIEEQIETISDKNLKVKNSTNVYSEFLAEDNDIFCKIRATFCAKGVGSIYSFGIILLFESFIQ